MHLPSRVPDTLVALSRIPREEVFYLAGPKGGQMSFFAFEDELLSAVHEKLPREHAPYVVTFCEGDLIQYDRGKERIEKLEKFQGWLKNMTSRIHVWPESDHTLVRQVNSPDLLEVAGNMALAVEHCPLELFGQKKIAEHESRIWVHGSIRSHAGDLNYVNTTGVSMYGPVRRRVRALCSHATNIHFSSGEVTEHKGMHMTARAAAFLEELPGIRHHRPGRLLKEWKMGRR
jgi:hypothetical protein